MGGVIGPAAYTVLRFREEIFYINVRFSLDVRSLSNLIVAWPQLSLAYGYIRYLQQKLSRNKMSFLGVLTIIYPMSLFLVTSSFNPTYILPIVTPIAFVFIYIFLVTGFHPSSQIRKDVTVSGQVVDEIPIPWYYRILSKFRKYEKQDVPSVQEED
ncbi:MAG: hypothetical protein GF411_00575 [Candidatus Lokiarchaeota archaeon]|nr:hypothetical protein [Candidatus Lokiarchaeota archaeon]